MDKQDLAVAGLCGASTLFAVLGKSPDLIAIPIAVIALNKDRIGEILRASGRHTEDEIKQFFREIDCLMEKAERKVKEVI